MLILLWGILFTDVSEVSQDFMMNLKEYILIIIYIYFFFQKGKWWKYSGLMWQGIGSRGPL